MRGPKRQFKAAAVAILPRPACRQPQHSYHQSTRIGVSMWQPSPPPHRQQRYYCCCRNHASREPASTTRAYISRASSSLTHHTILGYASSAALSRSFSAGGAASPSGPRPTPTSASRGVHTGHRPLSTSAAWRTTEAETTAETAELTAETALADEEHVITDLRTPNARIHHNRAYIALGSNVGDRLANIEDALAALHETGLRVTRTSSLYETAPMYVEDQASFYNAVCEILVPPEQTPLGLLDALQAIETRLGRVKTVDKGPRAIDLDILAFGKHVVDHDRLKVPHHSILEREFVLRPLADIVPDARLPGLDDSKTVAEHLRALPEHRILSPIVPLARRPRPGLDLLRPGLARRKTHIMGIFNMTPNSFSDGGRNAAGPDSPVVQGQLSAWLAAGASIIDIGGQSTAPGAPRVSAAEETARVVPLIEKIRADRHFDGVALSVDTFSAEVAEAAVAAGADLVNDVSAGQLDGGMLPAVSRLRVPLLLMHMRGDPMTMQRLCYYKYGVVAGVARELAGGVRHAELAGIPRWRLLLDPGLGFAKRRGQNTDLLRGMSVLAGTGTGAVAAASATTGSNAPKSHHTWAAAYLRGLPWVVGPSRKAFLGHITGVREPAARDWATAAAVSAAVAGGADVVRVHNPLLAETTAVADAIWRDAHEW